MRMEIYEEVLAAFREAAISQATLAKRLGKRPEQISRLLSGPGNWTIDTAAELLFAIDGSLARIERRWPSLGRQRNYSFHTHPGEVVSRISPLESTNTKAGDYRIQKVNS
jgi:hypothetical protein